MKRLFSRIWTVTFPPPNIFFLLIGLVLILALLFLNAAVTRRDDYLAYLPDEEYKGLSQDHPDLISYIRQLHILLPPSSDHYKLNNPHIQDTSQNGQSKIVSDIFKNKTNGTFVEAGAYDGEFLSNTLYLEKYLHWTGLLVEPDPWNFWSLKKKTRKSSILHGCLSATGFTKEVSFRQSDTMGHVVDSAEVKKGKGIFTRVKCFPLYSLLLAQNLTQLDFLSLDLEGEELKILQTLPWNKINIYVICVEYKHIPEKAKALTKYLVGKNYKLHSKIGDDLIFVKGVS